MHVNLMFHMLIIETRKNHRPHNESPGARTLKTLSA